MGFRKLALLSLIILTPLTLAKFCFYYYPRDTKAKISVEVPMHNDREFDFPVSWGSVGSFLNIFRQGCVSSSCQRELLANTLGFVCNFVSNCCLGEPYHDAQSNSTQAKINPSIIGGGKCGPCRAAVMVVSSFLFLATAPFFLSVSYA